MPDLTERRRFPDDEIVADAVRAVGEDDRVTDVPAGVETAVMRAWDARAARPLPQHRLQWRSLLAGSIAAAACGVLAAALWVYRGADTGTTSEPTQFVETNDVASYSLEAIDTTGLLLQEDPASFHLVRLSVQPFVLAAFGYPLANPTDTQPLYVEVLIGLDGVPRAIRRVESDGAWSWSTQ